MRNSGSWLVWIGAAVAGVVVAVMAFPRAVPFYPQDWTVTRAQATTIAQEHFAELGDEIENPYVVVELDESALVEKRLLNRLASTGAADLRRSPLADEVLQWRVTHYEAGKRPNEWTYRATVSPTGSVTSLRLGVPADQAGEAINSGTARQQADAFLQRAGFDLDNYERPELRRTDRSARTDLSFRYKDRRRVLGEEIPYGVEVLFAGERLAGFRPWIEDPATSTLQKDLQFVNLFGTGWFLMAYLLFPFVAYSFLRRYHEGEIGVRRAVQVFVVVALAGILLIIMTARSVTEGNSFGLNRAQTTWAWGFQLTILWISALALIAALSWSVGESRCRESWGHKLAAFDALFQRSWDNATVARSSFRGVAAGLALAGLLLITLFAFRSLGIETGMAYFLGPWWHNVTWAGVALMLVTFVVGIYIELFTWLFVLPAAVHRFGSWTGAALTSILAGIIFWPPVIVDPAWASMLLGIFQAAVLIGIFLKYDLLTALLASFSCDLLLAALPFLLADAFFLQLQGLIPLAAVALPLALSVRYLGSKNEFQYRYEDVPPHVRRIAERERQRVELETARRIQSSILPELPAQLAGVELAYAYLPASEVGGDFYDVLDLEDGRLAVAVGDVAGHGVSSGLVMSMAKSTLALQVTVDPNVEAVLETLNRMVYKTARQRLLTTLCYAVVDTQRLEMTYGSAGHLAPYRIASDGRAESFEAASYPLGVRDPSGYFVKTVPLTAGDRLFLFSDGVVEACHENSEELFGFERLQDSLEAHAAESPAGLRDGVLADLRRFTGPRPRQDDQTILILQLP